MPVTTDVRWSAGVPASWFRGRDPQMTLEEFKAKWCVGNVIASVDDSQQGSTVVAFRLSVGQV